MGLKSLFKRKKAASQSDADGTPVVAKVIGGGTNHEHNKKKSKTKQNRSKEDGRSSELVVPAASTDNTFAGYSEASQFGLSQMPHGSDVNIDLQNKNSKTSADDLPKVIATTKRQNMVAQIPSGWRGDGDNVRFVDSELQEPPSGNRRGPQLGMMDILQFGYSVLSCVAQCRPGDDSTVAPPIPEVIDPSSNDNDTVGSLTLVTIERDERRLEAAAAAAAAVKKGLGKLLSGTSQHSYDAVAETIAPVSGDLASADKWEKPIAPLFSAQSQQPRNRDGLAANDYNGNEGAMETKGALIGTGKEEKVDISRDRAHSKAKTNINSAISQQPTIMLAEQDKSPYHGRYGDINGEDESDCDCDSNFGTIGRHFRNEPDSKQGGSS